MKGFPVQVFFVTELGEEFLDEQGRHVFCDGCTHVERATTETILSGEVPCFECHAHFLFESYRPHYDSPATMANWPKVPGTLEAVQ